MIWSNWQWWERLDDFWWGQQSQRGSCFCCWLAMPMSSCLLTQKSDCLSDWKLPTLLQPSSDQSSKVSALDNHSTPIRCNGLRLLHKNQHCNWYNHAHMQSAPIKSFHDDTDLLDSNALWLSWKMGSKVVNFEKLFLRQFSKKIYQTLRDNVQGVSKKGTLVIFILFLF